MASKLPLCHSSLLQPNKLKKLSNLQPTNPRSTLLIPPFSSRSSSSTTISKFSWDDVSRISQSTQIDSPTQIDSSYLQSFSQRVRTCNRGIENKSHFYPFVVENQIVGYIHNKFSDHLRKFKDVFAFEEVSSILFGMHEYDGVYVTLHRSLELPEERTEAVGYVIKSLGGLIPGIRNELYPVKSSYGTPLCFSLERAAAPYFGIKAYGIHMNGYVDKDGEKFLWIGKRNEMKPTYPGMLDHLVAGGLPHNMTCEENVMKECEEEAGIPRSISTAAVPVGAVSYVDINGYCFKRDVLFCYDLKLTDGFVPNNQDGEVESFKLLPVNQVANIIHRTQYYKPNCALVVIDFLFRHGFIKPQSGYLELLESLKSGDFS